jgi:hypothetical protein
MVWRALAALLLAPVAKMAKNGGLDAFALTSSQSQCVITKRELG